MNRIAKLALIAIAAAGIAAPAFAQSYHSPGSHQSGRNAFAMVPGGAAGSALSPAATGGGSIGYNENLRRDQW
jgi:hypothetical protein